MKYPSVFEFAFMNTPTTVLKPRKSPVQVRSTATVEALHTATIQVLTRDGLMRCTTTRIAERAGMSVGSLYQYYPNRDALLTAVLELHLNNITACVEKACQEGMGKPIAESIAILVSAFLQKKFKNPEESKALYSIAAEHDGLRLIVMMRKRIVSAIESMLHSAPDIHIDDPELVAQIVLGVLDGPARAILEELTTPQVEANLSEQLILLLRGYLQQYKKI